MNLLKENFQTYKNSNNKNIITIGIIIFFVIWSIPPLTQSPGTGTDNSFILGLHWAQIKNFVWGEDFVFSHGPLSYLNYNLNLDSSLWINTIFFKILSLSFFYIVFAIFVLKTNSPIRNAIILGSLSIFLTRISFPYYPIIGLLFAFYLYLQYCKNYLLLIPLIFASSFMFFLKFDVALISMSVIIISSIYFLIKKRNT